MKMAKNVNRKLGGGSGSRVVTERPVRVGDRSKNVNVRAVSQVGQALGNKAGTDQGARVNPVEATYKGRAPAGGPGGIPLGNQKSLDVGGGGPGTGRNLWGKSGSNCVTGPVAPAMGAPRPKGRDTLAGE
jgi:hypothetical protein